MFRRVLIQLAALALLAATGCSPRPADYQPAFAPAKADARPEFSFAVHPLHNPQLLFQTYGPLVDHLNRQLPDVRLKLVASNNYKTFENRLAAGAFDFALSNPYQTLEARKHGYRIFGKVADDDQFRGLILVRRDGGIDTVQDLRGKVIGYPSTTALAATMMTQQKLRDLGLRRGDSRAIYVGSQESSIESVYRGVSSAAGTWPLPWNAYARDHREVAAAVEVKWTTAPLVHNGLVARTALPSAARQAVADALFNVNRTPEGRAVLERIGISAFDPATEASYAPVVAFLVRFDASGGVEPAAAAR